MTIVSDEQKQEEETVKPWVDPHKLKCINGIWYKEGRCVITGVLDDRRTVIKSHHDLPVVQHKAQQCR